MMTKLIASAIAFALLPVTAFAGTELNDVKEMKMTPGLRTDAGFYVGAYGGAQFDTGYGNKKQSLSGTAASVPAAPAGRNLDTTSRIHSNWGGAGGVKAGYNFASYSVCDDKLRLQPAVEVEALYLGTTSSNGLKAPALGLVAHGRTSYNSAAGFTNGILRFKNPTMVTPYLGVGVGGEYLTTHSDVRTTSPGGRHITGVSGDDVDFAGQALAGFDIALRNHWDAFTEYKFVDAVGTDIDTKDIGGSGLTYRFKPDQIQQSVVVAGVKYNF